MEGFPRNLERALASGRRILRCGHLRYFDYPFPALLQSLNEAIDPQSPLFPFLRIEPGSPVRLCYTLERAEVDRSSTLRARALPRACLAQLQEAINRLHAWAEDPQVPRGTQDFCRSFALPDPMLDPEAYHLTHGPGGWRVHILWGYDSDDAPAIKPLSKRATQWPDSAERLDLAERFRRARTRQPFPWRTACRVLLILLALLALGYTLKRSLPAIMDYVRAYRETTQSRLNALQHELLQTQAKLREAEVAHVAAEQANQQAAKERAAEQAAYDKLKAALATLKSRYQTTLNALHAAQDNQQAAEAQVIALQDDLKALKVQHAEQVRLVKQWRTKATQLEQQNNQLQEAKKILHALEAELKQARQQTERYRRICQELVGLLRRADPEFPEVQNWQELDTYLSKQQKRWWEFWKSSEGDSNERDNRTAR